MTVFQLEPITAPAGHCVPIKLEFLNDNGTVPDYSEYSCYYVLSQYGFEDTNVLSKTMILAQDTTNVFTTTVDSDDTSSLEEGAYTAKVILDDGSNYFKVARGSFNVLKDSNSVSVG